jgi:hypothetical protein
MSDAYIPLDRAASAAGVSYRFGEQIRLACRIPTNHAGAFVLVDAAEFRRAAAAVLSQIGAQR